MDGVAAQRSEADRYVAEALQGLFPVRSEIQDLIAKAYMDGKRVGLENAKAIVQEHRP